MQQTTKPKETAARVRQIRKELGLSQEALAAKLGVTRQTVYWWEMGINSIGSKCLLELSNLSGYSPSWILYGK